ncbi:DUF2057 family protein [Vibrio furnissii]|uniref:DUF2057 family protein n=1 Tax=Vibrio furnissii TaxID=29494 RepID=UPI00399A6286
MKILPVSLFVSLLAVSTGSYANIDVTFDRDIQLLAVNGESEGVTFGHLSELTLESGVNQLLVRAERVIQMSGKKNKYKSPLMVVKITGEEGKINIAPQTVIRNEDNAREFDRHPALAVEVLGGQLDVQQDFIPGRTFGLMGDYGKELANFNRTDSVAAISMSRHEQNQIQKIVKEIEQDSAAPKLERLKTFYQGLNLSEEERKAFLSWAVSQ